MASASAGEARNRATASSSVTATISRSRYDRLPWTGPALRGPRRARRAWCERPARADPRRQRDDRPGGARPRRRRRCIPARRALRRRQLLRPVRQARADRARRPGDARVRATVVRPAAARARGRRRRPGRLQRRRLALCARRARPGAGRARPAALAQRDDEDHRRPLDQLVRGRLPAPSMGRARLPRARARRRLRAALGGALAHLPARRARPDGRLGRAGRRSPGLRAGAERRGVRRDRALGAGDASSRSGCSRARSGRRATSSPGTGIRHLPNIPTEEVFTAPDPERVDGHVTSTRPLVLRDGTIIRGLRVRFEGGRAVEIEADENAEALLGRAAMDDGAGAARRARARRPRRAGSARSAPSSTTPSSTRTPRATSRSATPTRSRRDEEDRGRLNKSGIHIDFMIGSLELEVTGVTRDGERVSR